MNTAMTEDLKKFKEELEIVNKKLVDLGETRSQLTTHGVRLQGAIQYLQSVEKGEEDEAKAKAEAEAKAKAEAEADKKLT